MVKFNNNRFNSIEEALEDFKAGKPLVVVDDEDRENEGDIIVASERITPELVNFMAAEGRGLVCVAASGEILDRLQLPQMVANNSCKLKTAFTVSIDAIEGVSTGISAYDRSTTIQKMMDESSTLSDFNCPGHIFPLRANDGGVLVRQGHTEAAVELAKLAGLKPSGVICEIMNQDGTMSRGEQLFDFTKKHNLKIITIKDLVSFIKDGHSFKQKYVATATTPSSCVQMAHTTLPTEYGEFDLYLYGKDENSDMHVALVKGDIANQQNVLVRIHSECITGDLFKSLKCDCGEQLESSMKLIQENGSGAILYLRQEGRGIGFLNKIKAYNLQNKGLDTIDANIELGFEADLRDYKVGADILKDLGVEEVSLLTNNPCKISGLEKYGVKVKRVPIEIDPKEENLPYFMTKKNKMGHMFSEQIIYH